MFFYVKIINVITFLSMYSSCNNLPWGDWRSLKDLLRDVSQCIFWIKSSPANSMELIHPFFWPLCSECVERSLASSSLGEALQCLYVIYSCILLFVNTRS